MRELLLSTIAHTRIYYLYFLLDDMVVWWAALSTGSVVPINVILDMFSTFMIQIKIHRAIPLPHRNRNLHEDVFYILIYGL